MKQRGRISAANRAVINFNQAKTGDDPPQISDRERWRQRYLEIHEPGFAFCLGQRPGTTEAYWVYGAEARRRALRDSGIPTALIRLWDAERS